MRAIFPADNILASLCTEQKFFKQFIQPFSLIIPYCALAADETLLQNCSFSIEPAEAKQGSIFRSCLAHPFDESQKKFSVGEFILGTYTDSQKDPVCQALSQDIFPKITFKTFYLCDFSISEKKYTQWKISNIRWHKNKEH